jgi:hypothetical protein
MPQDKHFGAPQDKRDKQDDRGVAEKLYVRKRRTTKIPGRARD